MTAPPEFLTCVDGYAVLRPERPAPFAEILGALVEAIQWCRAEGVTRLLGDARAIPDMARPNTLQRLDLGAAVAAVAKGAVKVAMVAPPEIIDHDHIGAVAARNRGAVVEIFSDADEAVRWLMAPDGP